MASNGRQELDWGEGFLPAAAPLVASLEELAQVSGRIEANMIRRAWPAMAFTVLALLIVLTVLLITG